MKVKKITKNISAAITTAILAAFCSVNAFAADNDGWTNFSHLVISLQQTCRKVW